MDNITALEKKYEKIFEVLGGQGTFYINEVQAIFPDMKKSSLYWNMSKLVEQGYLLRIRNGVYAFNEWKGKRSVLLSGTAKKIRNLLDETGFAYFISGVDILQKYMQHVPESYPVIVYVEKGSKEEIRDILSENNIMIIEPLQIKDMYEKYSYLRQFEYCAVLYQTDSFEYSENGVASIEKAFVDTYYSITRHDYPVALQELVRIYQNLSRLGNIDKRTLITVASRRSIQYDIRFIVESKFITEEALKFVEILRKEE